MPGFFALLPPATHVESGRQRVGCSDAANLGVRDDDERGMRKEASRN